jgi:hypothetical protein
LYFGDSDEAGQKIRKNVEAELRFYQGQSNYLTIPVEVELRLVAITPQQVKKHKLAGYQLEAFLTTPELVETFKQILQDVIDDCWDEDIYKENCPDEEYDYEAHGLEEPEDIDPDTDIYDPATGTTIRRKMVQMPTDAFKPGWENQG